MQQIFISDPVAIHGVRRAAEAGPSFILNFPLHLHYWDQDRASSAIVGGVTFPPNTVAYDPVNGALSEGEGTNEIYSSDDSQWALNGGATLSDGIFTIPAAGSISQDFTFTAEDYVFWIDALSISGGLTARIYDGTTSTDVAISGAGITEIIALTLAAAGNVSIINLGGSARTISLDHSQLEASKYRTSRIIADPPPTDRAATTFSGCALTPPGGVAIGKPPLPDFVTELLNGVLGANQTTGSTVIGTIYEITATTADYFGAGLVVGDRFEASSSVALSASNAVKEVTPIRTEISLRWYPWLNWDDIADPSNILILSSSGNITWARRSAGNGTINTTDGATFVAVVLNWQKNTAYDLRIRCGIKSATENDMLNPSGTGPATGLADGLWFQIGVNGAWSNPDVFGGYYETGDYLQTLGLSDSMQIQNIQIRSLVGAPVLPLMAMFGLSEPMGDSLILSNPTPME